MARQGGAGRRGGILLEKIFIERWLWFFAPPRWFALWFWGRFWGRWAGFARQFEVIVERDREHVAERAQHAAYAWVFAGEARQISVFEEADEVTAHIGDVMAGVGLQQPALLHR